EVGTFEWNVVSGEVHCNERWAGIIGYQLNELRPLSLKTWLDNTHPDDWVMAAERFKRHIRGELPKFDCELRMRHKEGHWIWVRNLGRIIEWSADGAALVMSGLHIDISERKETEARLRASEKSLDTTGRLAGVGGWEVNLLTNEIIWSDQTCRIHDMPVGYRPDMAEALSFYPPESRKAIEDAISKAIENGAGWDIELPMVTAKGHNIWTHTVGSVEFEDGRACRLVGAFQDITWRKRATLALEVGERRFRKLFQHSLGLICTHDLDGNLLSINPASARALGYPLSALMGRDFREIIPKANHAEFDDYLRRIRANKSDSGSFQLIASDGTQHTWQFHNVLDGEDDEPYVIGHAQDITERELNERELRELSIRDPLTGCFNRRSLREVEQKMQHGDRWGCIGIDLDRFKQVNDTYGHQRGDEVLVAMGQFLSGHARASDIVFRVGGDEFLMLVKDADEALTLERVEAINADRSSAPIGFTLGHAVRQPGHSLDSALAEADRQLYEVRARART
ncbi:PAS domain S-box protein, partial [Dokdonella sp.]|uniref:PAS domain S-box protein n=1 Tax=Dokdonella sp. TaxID=2291710 RepID=UPI003C434A61